MSRRLSAAAAALLSVLAAGPVSTAASDELPLIGVAILDVNRVFKEANAVRALQAKLRKYAEAYRTETQREEAELRNAHEELSRKRGILTADAYEIERQRLEQRLILAQATVQQQKQGLELAEQQGLNQVQAALNQIVASIGAERQLVLILRKDHTVLVSATVEITDEVLRRLNAELTTVDIAAPGN